ncbi:MAG: hypothetical protein JWO20_3322 [Candidatus Angelobacter sp.]|nr:hypothetical protein [Candidatus Angelobacter sp.]
MLTTIPVETRAGIETVEIGTVQVSKSLSGVVVDQMGSAIKSVLVEECGPDWQICNEATRTDTIGFFSFKSANKQKIHYLRFSMNLFNPVVMRVRLSNWTTKPLKVRLPLST